MIAHFNGEANIVHQCNNRCAACNHLSPFAPPYFMSPEVLERDLKWCAKLMHFDIFRLQGGEPLLHPWLLELMDILCRSAIATTPGVLTNGKLLPQMDDAFWRKCHDLEMELCCTIYPNLPEESLRIATAKAAQFKVNFRPAPASPFLKMLHPNDGGSFAGCPWKQCWCVHEGWFFACPIAPFLAPQIMNLPMETDGLKLSDATTEADIMAYVERKEPFQSCRMCAGTHGGGLPWHQVRNMEEWIKDSTV